MRRALSREVRWLLSLPVVSAALLMGCGSQIIPNTTIDDTPANREVVAFCEEYRNALEHRRARVSSSEDEREGTAAKTGPLQSRT